MYFNRIMNLRMGNAVIVVATAAAILASCDKDQPKPTAAAATSAVVAASPAPTPAPEVAAPTPAPPPQCKKDCEENGSCTLADGKCIVTADADCKRSDGCKSAGYCTAGKFPGSEDSKLLLCLPMTDADCKDSKRCREDGGCKAVDGDCVNPAGAAEQAMRLDTIRSIRTMLWASAQDGLAYKRETLKILTENFGNDYGKTVWTKLEQNLFLWDGKTREDVAKQRKNASPDSSPAWALAASSSGQLGEACVSALRADGVRAQNEFVDAAFHDIDWMMKAGGSACGPTSTPAISKCGKAEAPEKARSRPGWREYSCQFQDDVGASWSQCLLNKDLSKVDNEGCPGRMRCCPGVAAK